MEMWGGMDYWAPNDAKPNIMFLFNMHNSDQQFSLPVYLVLTI